MAVKKINPQLEAYYNQTKHPMPDFLQDVNQRNIHDVANMRFNERLWQTVKQLNEEDKEPSVHEFRRIAADVRRQIDAELYECDDVERLSMAQICNRIIDAQIGFSPVNLGEDARGKDGRKKDADSNSTSDNLPQEPLLVVTISLNTRGLSKTEAKWLEECFKEHQPDLSGGDHTIALGSSIQVDSMEGVDRWLPRRIKMQLLGHIKDFASKQDIRVKLPFSFRLKSFLDRVL